MFTEPDTWAGGGFELVLELGPRDDARLGDAVAALWEHPTLTGCFLKMTVEPSRQDRVAPDSQPLRSHLYGVAATPAGGEVACVSYPIRFDDGVEWPYLDVDWLYLSIPMCSLGTAYPVGAYPMGAYPVGGYPMCADGAADWIPPVGEWLREIGIAVFAAVPFRLGLVGWEPDDEDQVSALIERDGVPEDRWIGYLRPVGGALRWYPQNNFTAPIT